MGTQEGVTESTAREIAEQTLRSAARDLAREGETRTTNRAVAGWLHQRAASLASVTEHEPSMPSPRAKKR